MNNPTIYLFRFTSYTYCQGTRDVNRGDMRLLQFAEPTPEDIAILTLQHELMLENIGFHVESIEVLTKFITN